MSTLVQKERGRASWRITGQLLGTHSHHVPMLDPEMESTTSDKPHTATGMKLQPSGTAPHGFRPVSAQRGELLGNYRKNESLSVCGFRYIYLFHYFHRVCQERFLELFVIASLPAAEIISY